MYVSPLFDVNNDHIQLLCINSKSVVLCIQININYPSNIFITNTKELIYHSFMTNNLISSEFNTSKYPYRNQEILDFQTNIIPLLAKNSTNGLYSNKGEVKYILFRLLYNRYNPHYKMTLSYKSSFIRHLPSDTYYMTINYLLIELSFTILLILTIFIYLLKKYSLNRFFYFLDHKINKNLKSLTEGIKAIKNGDINKRLLKENSDNEIELCSKTVNDLRILIKFRIPNEGDYPDLLFSYSQQFVFFKAFSN